MSQNKLKYAQQQLERANHGYVKVKPAVEEFFSENALSSLQSDPN